LDQAGQASFADQLFEGLPIRALRAAVAAGVNAPMSSSAGRLYDAVAACLGLCPAGQSYEGEAAMRLEAMAVEGEEGYAFGPGLDPVPMFGALARDLQSGVARERIAGRFQEGLATAFAAPALALLGQGRAKAVALTGGCFQNAALLATVERRLSGVPVMTHRVTPANDGGLALGQAMVALARMGGTSSATA
jgi:hydrogenase maturation protein HypF